MNLTILLAVSIEQRLAALLPVVSIIVVIVVSILLVRRLGNRKASIDAVAEAALERRDIAPILDALKPRDRAPALAGAAWQLAEDGENGDVALDLARRALREPTDDGAVLLKVAYTYQALGRLDLLRPLLQARTDHLEPAHLGDLANVALEAELPELAEQFTARALAANPRNVELMISRGAALLALDRAEEAATLLGQAMIELRRRIDADYMGTSFAEQMDVVQDMHEEAVRCSSSAEKAIDAHVAARQLDPRAGGNYRLIGQSLLVDSTRPPRRVRVASQDALRADADAALHDDPRSVAGLEDLGLWYLREGEPHNAEDAFQRALDVDAKDWPALMGLGAALDTHRKSLRALVKDAVVPTLPDLARLVDPWTALTKDEQALVAISVAPLAHLLPKLLEAGGRLHVISLDGRCTDLPEFADARGVLVEDADDRRTHDAIEGMALGPVAAARIDTWYALDRDGCTVAHELGHALHSVIDDAWAERLADLFEQAEDSEYLSTEYGQTNIYEFFATGYERFALRLARPDGPRNEQDEADRLLGVDAFFRELSASQQP